MLTIALDEQGDFENVKNENAPVFIGGILYDDKNAVNDYDNEKRRLEAYLRKVCSSVGREYPKDLHFSEDGAGGNNSAAVREVKTKLRETLTEFFTQGTFEGSPLLPSAAGSRERRDGASIRRGKYHIFLMLKSEEGKTSLLKGNVSELIKDNFAGNLYVHMAEEVVSRVVFHNPIIQNIGKVRLELATRRAVIEGDNIRWKIEEYRKLGYKEDVEHSTDTRRVVLLTNSDNYRTALEREMLDTEKDNIMIDRISVKSIYYQSPDSRMVFLYLADIICAMFGFHPKGGNPVEWMEAFDELSETFTGHQQNFLFAYDSIDTYFKKAYDKFEDKDYYKALSLAYDGMNMDSSFAPYYKKTWFHRLEENLKKERDISAYTMALRKLQESVLNNNVNQEKLLYIFHGLESMQEQMNFGNRENQAVLYELYDAGVAAYCHIGDSKHAEEYFEMCKKYAQYVGFEAYLRTRNKMVVFLCDYFHFEEAYRIAKENVEYHNELLTMRKRLFLDEALADSIGHAIALSQAGQIAAYENLPEAEDYFLKSLSEFEKDSPNYLITQSYLMHYYISSGNKEAFIRECNSYFGPKQNQEKRFHYIIREGMKEKNAKFSMKFALYLFVKGIYTFHMEELTDELAEKLLHVEEAVAHIEPMAVKQINGHPWELIYKYLALIALAKGQETIAASYMEKAEKIIRYRGFTIDAIIEYGKAEFAAAQNRMEECGLISKNLWSKMEKEIGGQHTNDFAKVFESLGQRITYMYK